MTEVVAALITDGKRFLICRRPAHKSRALLWEFPGGKIEPGESPEKALERECKEELSILTQTGPLYAESIHTYPDISIRLRLYHCRIVSGIPQALEHCELKWIGIDDISGYSFCPADIVFTDELLKRGY